jgi:hypothetical protein
MSQSASARVAIGAVIVLVVAACSSSAGAGPTLPAQAASPAPEASRAPSPAAPSATASAASAAPSAEAGPTSYDTTALGASFALPLTLELPAHWRALEAPEYGAIGTVAFVHTGANPNDESAWWGFGLELVDGASVIDPASLTSTATSGNDMKWLPWPASYTDYLAGLPGVEVAGGPEPVTVAGQPGTRVIFNLPAMHPTVYLKDDFTWLGGGQSGIDPVSKRQVIELKIGGKNVLIDYADSPTSFDSRLADVNAIIDTIKTMD